MKIIRRSAMFAGLITAITVSQSRSQEADIPVPVARPKLDDIVATPTPRPTEPSSQSTSPEEIDKMAILEDIKRDPQPGVCRNRLVALGVRFENRETISEKAGCYIGWLVTLLSLGGDIAIVPETVLNCATAVTIARFAKQVNAFAITHFGQELKAIRHDSTYICRGRSDGTKLSEHAYGNAVDISAFRLADGREIAVRLRDKGEDLAEADFQRAVRKAACGPFTTVLGPGTKADHASHFHFDRAPRRKESTYCR